MGGDRRHHIQDFYSLLERLERVTGLRRLSDCHGRMGWAERGVYFFFEDGELRNRGGARVVRVGTHALKTGSQTSLWKRLSQHKGRARSGSGNHRGSIFRLIVGTALIHRNGMKCPSWDRDKSPATAASEFQLEQAVSREIGAMPFLWLDINDEPGPNSLRGFIERNSIALLSSYGKCAVDPPSDGWLGHWCDRPRVRTSGLWNNNHVDETYDPAFLPAFETLVSGMEVRT